jgi:hypothetical protein
MAREHVGNYAIAERVGMFGQARPVMGGLDPDALRHVMENPHDEQYWDQHAWNVLLEDR